MRIIKIEKSLNYWMGALSVICATCGSIAWADNNTPSDSPDTGSTQTGRHKTGRLLENDTPAQQEEMREKLLDSALDMSLSDIKTFQWALQMSGKTDFASKFLESIYDEAYKTVASGKVPKKTKAKLQKLEDLGEKSKPSDQATYVATGISNAKKANLEQKDHHVLTIPVQEIVGPVCKEGAVCKGPNASSANLGQDALDEE